jgi:hypothetical protein
MGRVVVTRKWAVSTRDLLTGEQHAVGNTGHTGIDRRDPLDAQDLRVFVVARIRTRTDSVEANYPLLNTFRDANPVETTVRQLQLHCRVKRLSAGVNRACRCTHTGNVVSHERPFVSRRRLAHSTVDYSARSAHSCRRQQQQRPLRSTTISVCCSNRPNGVDHCFLSIDSICRVLGRRSHLDVDSISSNGRTKEIYFHVRSRSSASSDIISYDITISLFLRH